MSRQPIDCLELVGVVCESLGDIVEEAFLTVVLEALVAFPVVVVVFFGARDARIPPLHAPPT